MSTDVCGDSTSMWPPSVCLKYVSDLLANSQNVRAWSVMWPRQPGQNSTAWSQLRAKRTPALRDGRIHCNSCAIARLDRWIQEPQVALTTLKLRAHACPLSLCKDTPTQSLQACKLPSSSSLGWEVKRLQQTETSPVIYDTALKTRNTKKLHVRLQLIY